MNSLREEVREALASAMEVVMLGWCQGTPAKNASGRQVCADGPKAVSWCAVGAVWRAVGSSTRVPPGTFPALEQVVGNVATWNDRSGRTQAEVIEGFARAIDYVEGGGAL